MHARVRSTGISGWSPLLNPGPERLAAFPSLSHLWDLGPGASALYDTMHLFFSKVVPNFWGLLSGTLRAGADVVDEFLLPVNVRTDIANQYRAAVRTVPVHNIDKRSGSFKAVEWLFFLLCYGEALMYGKVPDYFYDMFMCLRRAGRLLFPSNPVSAGDLVKIDKEIKNVLSILD